MKFRLLSVFAFALLSGSAGAQQVNWAKTPALPANSEVTAMATDQAGYLYVAGRFEPTQPERYAGLYAVGNVFLTKYDSLGNTIWSRNFTGEGRAFDLTVDAGNNLLMCGAFYSSLAFGTDTINNLPVGFTRFGSFLAKLDTSGNLQWVNPTVSPDYDLAMVAAATDAQSNIYVTGIDEQVDGLFAKYDANGNFIWKKQVAGVRTYSDVAVSLGGEVVVSGTCSPFTGFDAVTPAYAPQVGYFNFMLKCNSQGITQSAVVKPFITFHFSSAVAATGTDVLWHYDSYPQNNSPENHLSLYNGGTETDLYQDPEPATGFYPISLAGNAEGKIVFMRNFAPFMMAPAELTLYAFRNGSFSPTPDFQATGLGLEGTALAASGEAVYVGGQFFQQSLLFGSFTLQNPHNSQAWETQPFIARISPAALATENQIAKELLQLYPNPSAGAFSVVTKGNIQPTCLEILDSEGRLLQTQTWPQGQSSLQVHTNLPAGFYMARIKTASGFATRKLALTN